jgi:glycosyltransferase involved in cell wall biosynthesis
MKVIFLTHASDQGHRFRVEQYFPFLRSQGVTPKWGPLQGSLKERLKIYRELPSFDVVCIQRRLLAPFEFTWIRKASKKILFDLDDAVMFRSSSSPRPHSFSRWLKFRWMVKGSDLVTVGNRFLREQVLRVDRKKKVFLIPTSIDPGSYPIKKKVTLGPEVVLGWMGTRGNLKYLSILEPVFQGLAQKFPHLRLKIVSNDSYTTPYLPTLNKPWRLEDENEDLVSFDIGLMPLGEDLWSQGKCGLKVVQYLSVGVPAVCTPVGINSDIIRNGENGYWATTPREWEDHLTALIQDADLRQRFGRNGMEVVEKEYSLAVTSEKVLKMLRYLSDGSPVA